MLFSVIVPVYHVEEFLPRCVDSIINQTYKDIEIILVDDGSNDNCPEMCDNYAKADGRIKVIHKKNGGLSDARNAGLDIATGDYIIFVDSDDYIEKETCQKVYEHIKAKPDIIIGDAIVEGGTNRLKHISFSGELSGKEYLCLALNAGHAPMATWLNIYKNTFLKNNGLRFKYGILHEDEEFTPKAFLKAQSVVRADINFYHYVIRNDSITTKKDKKKNLTDYYDTCEELSNLIYKIDDKCLKNLILNSLVFKYLTLYVTAKGYEYGKEYYHKAFIIKNAKTFKTRFQSILYCISPKMYCKIVELKRK